MSITPSSRISQSNCLLELIVQLSNVLISSSVDLLTIGSDVDNKMNHLLL
jgi:hypothetical protein